MKNKFLLSIIGAQLQAFGSVLRGQDSDDKGTDDLFGHILQTAGSALGSFSNNDDKGLKKYLKIIADTINQYLAAPTA